MISVPDDDLIVSLRLHHKIIPTAVVRFFSDDIKCSTVLRKDFGIYRAVPRM